jgi:hypothetical protein
MEVLSSIVHSFLSWLLQLPHDAAWVQDYAVITATIMAAGGLWFNARAIKTQVRTSKAQKQIDVVMECNRRYEIASSRVRDVVRKFKTELSSQSEIDLYEALEEPFRAYWLVYYEEWQFYRIGMVPTQFFKYWCIGLSRNIAAPSMEGFGSIQLWDAWRRYGESSWGYTGLFVEHIRELKRISELPEPKWSKELDKTLNMIHRSSKKIHRELGG